MIVVEVRDDCPARRPGHADPGSGGTDRRCLSTGRWVGVSLARPGETHGARSGRCAAACVAASAAAGSGPPGTVPGAGGRRHVWGSVGTMGHPGASVSARIRPPATHLTCSYRQRPMSRQWVYLLGRQGVRGSNPLSSTEAGPKGSYSTPAEFDGAHAGGIPPMSPLTSRLASRSRRSAVRVAAGRARPASSSGFGEPFPAERTINLALQSQTRLMRGRIARCRAEPPLPASVGRHLRRIGGAIEE